MLLKDDDYIDLSYERQLRAAESLTQTILANLALGEVHISPELAKAVAGNIVAGLPVLGIP